MVRREAKRLNVRYRTSDWEFVGLLANLTPLFEERDQSDVLVGRSGGQGGPRVPGSRAGDEGDSTQGVWESLRDADVEEIVEALQGLDREIRDSVLERFRSRTA